MADADTVVVPSPTSALEARMLVAALGAMRLVHAAADALAYLCLASVWFLCASSAAMIVGSVVCRCGGGEGEGSQSLAALKAAALEVSLFAIVLLLALLVAVLLCACGLVAIGSWFGFNISFEIKKSFGAITWELPREWIPAAAVYGWLASLAFVLLTVASHLVIMWWSPVEGSKAERIGAVMMDVGLVGSMEMCCLIVFPALALKIWRTNREVQRDTLWQKYSGTHCGSIVEDCLDELLKLISRA